MTSDPDSVVDSISPARCRVLPWRRLAEKGSPHSRKIFSKCIENTQYNLFPRLVGIKSYDCRNWNISQYFNKNIINLREAANQRAASNHVTPMWQSNVSDFPQRVFKATSSALNLQPWPIRSQIGCFDISLWFQVAHSHFQVVQLKIKSNWASGRLDVSCTVHLFEIC